MRLKVALLLFVISAAACHAAGWTKYVALEDAFSFHYPQGWKIQADEAIVQAKSPDGAEDLLLILYPAEGKTARAAAEAVLGVLQQQMPSLRVTQWGAEGKQQEFVRGKIAYTEEDRAFTGDIITVTGGGVAFWFAYSAPENRYSQLRAGALLEGMMTSFESDASSAAPEVAIPVVPWERLERNANAFIFVLEFGAGTAFSSARERLVRDEVIKAWADLPAEELAKYDEYPKLMKVILALKQQDLAELQAEIKQSVQEILAEGETSPAIRTIAQQLDESNRALVEGTPPLTASAAEAYAELMGFAEVLAQKPAAGPEHVPDSLTSEIRGQLVKAWGSFSDTDKQAVLGSPALWMAVRVTFRQGTAQEKQEMRNRLVKLAPKPAPKPQTASGGGSATSGSSSSGQPMSWAAHQTMLAVQKMTFNSYMWSRGYPGWTRMGKF